MKFKEIPKPYSDRVIKIFRTKIYKDIMTKVIEFLYVKIYNHCKKDFSYICFEATDDEKKYINYYHDQSVLDDDFYYHAGFFIGTETKLYLGPFKKNVIRKKRKQIFKERIKKLERKFKELKAFNPKSYWFSMRTFELSVYNYYNS